MRAVHIQLGRAWEAFVQLRGVIGSTGVERDRLEALGRELQDAMTVAEFCDWPAWLVRPNEFGGFSLFPANQSAFDLSSAKYDGRCAVGNFPTVDAARQRCEVNGWKSEVES